MNDTTEPESPAPFASKAVLVTGGTSGIGRATALAFARRGADVAILGRNAQRGQAAVAACRAAGGTACFIPVDVGDGDRIGDAIRRSRDQLGRLDIAFNNAGVQEKRAALAEQPDEGFDAVFDVNVRSLFLAMKAEIALMLPAGGGVIINNASVSGLRNPNPGLALYSASKAAVLSLTRSAALEYDSRG